MKQEINLIEILKNLSFNLENYKIRKIFYDNYIKSFINCNIEHVIIYLNQQKTYIKVKLS